MIGILINIARSLASPAAVSAFSLAAAKTAGAAAGTAAVGGVIYIAKRVADNRARRQEIEYRQGRPVRYY